LFGCIWGGGKSTNETGKNICKTSEEIERFTVDEIKHFSD